MKVKRNEEEWVDEERVKPMVVKSPSVGELAIASRTGSDLDTLIWLARKFPRNMEMVKGGVLSHIISPSIAEKITYRFYRKDKEGKLKEIIGISIRGAEIILQHMGNLLVRGYIEERDGVIYGVGMVIDLERLIAISNAVRVQQIIPGEDGRILAENTAISKGIRNAILRLVPPEFIEEMITKVREVIKKGIKKDSVAARFQKAVEKFATYGLSERDLLSKLEVDSPEQLTEDHIVKLLELYNALEEGQISADTLKEQDKVPKPTSLGDILKGSK